MEQPCIFKSYQAKNSLDISSKLFKDESLAPKLSLLKDFSKEREAKEIF